MDGVGMCHSPGMIGDMAGRRPQVAIIIHLISSGMGDWRLCIYLWFVISLLLYYYHWYEYHQYHNDDINDENGEQH